MTDIVKMRHPELGITKKGFYGFSWSTMAFGPFPALFRADFPTFFVGLGVTFILGCFLLSEHHSITGSIIAYTPWLIWGFMYNRYYTCRLLERGYVFDDRPEKVEKARRALKVEAPREA